MKLVTRPSLVCALLLATAALTSAQPLDPNYNPNANSDVFAVVAQPDGKILVGGNFSSLGGTPRSRLARMNTDGSVDASFNPNPNTTVSAIALQPDGRIVLGGVFVTVGGVARVRLARILATGALDTAFNASTDNNVRTLAVQGDGKILLGGLFTIVNGAPRTYLARVNVDGSLDDAFNPVIANTPTGYQLRVDVITVQPNGKILVGGTFLSVNGRSSQGIARLNADGSRDTSFSEDASAANVRAIVLQPDGKIIVGGSFVSFGGLPRMNLARLRADGLPDAQFGIVGPSSTINSLLLQPDGKVVAGGFFAAVSDLQRTSLARFNADGSLDPSFVFNTAGANGGSAPGVYAIASPASGQLVVGGTFSSVNGVTRNGIARIGIPPPSIVTPPRPQTFATAQTITLSVAASGTGLSYQWLRNGTALAGATSSSLSIPNASAAHAGSYSVTVTNSTGSVTSAAAVITIDPKSVYLVQGPASQSVTSGTDVTLTVTAMGQTPLTYQWFKDGVALPAATASTLALGLALPDHSGSYTVAVGDPSGNVTSTAALLTVTGEIPYLVTTLAGSLRNSGSTDGAGADARFNNLADVAVDAAGYVYVSDRVAHTIRKISPTGVVSTLAGRAGASGSADGSGANALFNAPGGLVVDRTGHVFVADTNNNRIRKITPLGVVTTFVGQTQGSIDGPATVARILLPNGLAADAAGNLYCSEGGPNGQTIRKITPAGTVTTLAGLARTSGTADGNGANARFNSLGGLAVDEAGNVYAADTGNNTIRRITPAGDVTTFAGQAGTSGSNDGTGAGARFSAPTRVTIDPAGNLFVASSTAIRRITPDGVVTTPIGAVTTSSYLDGLGGTARFSALAGVASDAQGSLYICDASNFVIRKATLLGRKGSRLANLSVRSRAGTDNDTLIVGFNVAGGSKSLLLRAVGPTLGTLGVSGVLADPSMRLESDGALIAQNDNWDAGPTGDAIRTAAASVGAFALPAASRDAALQQSLNAGSFTAEVGGGTGVALVEVYEVGSASTGRLGNLSARTRAGTDADTLIVGFVIGGDAAKTVLIRGIGPTLSAFGVGGVLANPRLQLYRDAMLVAENSTWGGSTALATAFGQVGAFPLAADSRDAALLVTLLPGAYTAQITGAANTTGVALVEIYDML